MFILVKSWLSFDSRVRPCACVYIYLYSAICVGGERGRGLHSGFDLVFSTNKQTSI